MDVSSIAAASTVRAQQQVAQSVGMYCLKQANAQQASVATLLEGAMEMATAIAETGKGAAIDTYA